MFSDISIPHFSRTQSPLASSSLGRIQFSSPAATGDNSGKASHANRSVSNKLCLFFSRTQSPLASSSLGRIQFSSPVATGDNSGKASHANRSVSYKLCLFFSRTQSPLASSSLGRIQFSSPAATGGATAAKASPAAGRTPLSFSASNTTSYMDSTIRPQEGLEPIPELCLDHLWTESANTRYALWGLLF